MPEERLRDVVEGGRAVSEEQDVVVLHGPPSPCESRVDRCQGQAAPGAGEGKMPWRGVAAASRLQRCAV